MNRPKTLQATREVDIAFKNGKLEGERILIEDVITEINKIKFYGHFGLIIGAKTGRDFLDELIQKLKSRGK